MKNKKCAFCEEKFFLEEFIIPWISEIVAKDKSGHILCKWKEQLVSRKIFLCPNCAKGLATVLGEVDESLGGKIKNEE